MLPNSEIIAISENNQLQRADVFKMRSLFGSMCKMSQLSYPSVKEGIAVEFFIKTCSFLLTVLPEISRRVLIAAGKFT